MLTQRQRPAFACDKFQQNDSLEEQTRPPDSHWRCMSWGHSLPVLTQLSNSLGWVEARESSAVPSRAGAQGKDLRLESFGELFRVRLPLEERQTQRKRR